MRGSRVPEEVREIIRREYEEKTIGKICKDHCLSRSCVRKILKER